MKKRRHGPSDSLDLLLDTICNTFGGIIFIALMVVLLLLVSDRPDAGQNEDDASEIVALRLQLETLESLRSRLQANLQQQEEIIAEMTPNDLTKSLGDHQQELSRHTEFKTSIAAAQKKIAFAKQQDEEILEQLANVKNQIAALQLETEGDHKTLASHRESRRQVLGMPVARPTGQKAQVIVVLQFNRFYIWHRYSSQGIREGLNTDDFLVLSDQASGTVTAPNPAAGIPLNRSQDSKRLIMQELSRFRPQRHYLGVIVRPDSYGAFQHLREIATSMKLEYDLEPTTLQAEWFDRGGSGGLVQ